MWKCWQVSLWVLADLWLPWAMSQHSKVTVTFFLILYFFFFLNMSWLAPCFYNPAGLPSLLLWYVCVNFSSPQCRWLPLLPRNDAGCLPQKKSTAFTDKLTIMSHWARNVTLSLFTSYVCFKFSFCDSAVVQLMIFNVHVNFFFVSRCRDCTVITQYPENLGGNAPCKTSCSGWTRALGGCSVGCQVYKISSYYLILHYWPKLILCYKVSLNCKYLSLVSFRHPLSVKVGLVLIYSSIFCICGL